jgi:hypothetical protein
MTASSLRWPLAALIGLLIAVGVAVLATQLVSEKIGITAEPVTAGESLAPKHAQARRKPAHARPGLGQPTPQSSSTGISNPAGGSPSDSPAESEGGNSDYKPKGSMRAPASPPTSATPAPSASTPAGGGSDTARPEPGDD